jgi:hypothetical protein
MLSVIIAHASLLINKDILKTRATNLRRRLQRCLHSMRWRPAVLPTLRAPSLYQPPFGPLIVSDISAAHTEGLERAPCATNLSHLSNLPEEGPYFLPRMSPSRESPAKRRVKWHPARGSTLKANPEVGWVRYKHHSSGLYPPPVQRLYHRTIYNV